MGLRFCVCVWVVRGPALSYIFLAGRSRLFSCRAYIYPGRSVLTDPAVCTECALNLYCLRFKACLSDRTVCTYVLYVCMYACMYLSTYRATGQSIVYARVLFYVLYYIPTYVSIYIHIYVCVHIKVYILAGICMYVYGECIEILNGPLSMDGCCCLF